MVCRTDRLRAVIEFPRSEFHVDVAAIVPILGAMVFVAALLDDMIFPVGTRRPSRARLLAEMTKTLLDGVRGEPQPDRSAGGVSDSGGGGH